MHRGNSEPGRPLQDQDLARDLGANECPEVSRIPEPSYHPYPNWSSFALGNWYWSKGVLNSKERFGELLRILSHPDFNKGDVCSTSWDRIHRILPNNLAVLPDASPPNETQSRPTLVDDTGFGWSIAEVNLEVPFPNRGQGRRVKTFKAGVLHHRSIVSVIKEKMADPMEFLHRHYQPYEHMWQPCPQREPIRIYGELYTSNEFLSAQDKVQRKVLTTTSNLGLERVVVALMFWSDATLLANFGTAKLWPCYLFFGNDSKYLRAKPSSNLCSHIAYFEMASSFPFRMRLCEYY
jgi:Plavaka transposase